MKLTTTTHDDILFKFLKKIWKDEIYMFIPLILGMCFLNAEYFMTWDGKQDIYDYELSYTLNLFNPLSWILLIVVELIRFNFNQPINYVINDLKEVIQSQSGFITNSIYGILIAKWWYTPFYLFEEVE